MKAENIKEFTNEEDLYFHFGATYAAVLDGITKLASTAEGADPDKIGERLNRLVRLNDELRFYFNTIKETQKNDD